MHRFSPFAVVFCALAALTSCDTGDGTDLQTPSAPTSFAPLDTTPLSSVAIDPTLPADDLGTETSVDAGDEAGEVPDETPVTRLFAPWADGGTIDPRFGCDGSNIAPALSWSEVPAGTAELAVSFVDETNLSNGAPFVHWVMTGIPVDGGSGSLAEGEIPPGAAQALNFFGDAAYAGPCPNPGETNTYRLTLHALPQQLEIADGAPATEFLDAIAMIVITTAEVTGISSR